MIRKFFLVCLFSILSVNIYAQPIGLSISVPVVDKDPGHLQGYRAAITYFPPCFVWGLFSVYFDASYGHWWITDDSPNKSLSIYSIAPYLRVYFTKNPTISPFFEASIGPSYLSKTRIENRNLGIHFSFQDQLTLGADFGPDQHLYASISAVHYSNGSIASSNSGITIPIVLNVGYRF